MGKQTKVDTSDAEAMKLAGNKAFSAKNFEEAIEWYTKAIALNGKNHIFFANRK
jgi:hypothetical protein